MKLIINTEFEKLIPPLSKEEYEQLEKNILSEGIRDALLLWNGTIIDGHNRYKIAQSHSLKFNTVEKDFDNEDQAKVWMIDNQKGRRNLSDGWKFELAIKKKNFLTEKGKDNLRTNIGGNHVGLLSVDKGTHNTRKIIAEELGWSDGKAAQAEVVYNKFPEVWDKVKAGEKTVGEAYKEVKKVEKKQAVKQKEQQHKEDTIGTDNFTVDLFNTDKKFNIIYADPAWKYWEGGEKNQSLHYNTMTVDEIKILPVNKISDDNCILFLWVTFPILKDCFEIIEAWGFKYSTCGFVWVKKNKNVDSYFFGNGAWTRANSELCLIATKGSVTRIDASISQIIDDPVSEHSAKPTRVRELITRLVGELPRIELFSRNETKDGWFNWGNHL